MGGGGSSFKKKDFHDFLHNYMYDFEIKNCENLVLNVYMACLGLKQNAFLITILIYMYLNKFLGAFFRGRGGGS